MLTDTDQSRFLEVARDRTIAACEELWKTLTKPQLEQIELVSMDMWQAFMNSSAKHVPYAKIMHDKFHIAKYLGERLCAKIPQSGVGMFCGFKFLLFSHSKNLLSSYFNRLREPRTRVFADIKLLDNGLIQMLDTCGYTSGYFVVSPI